MKTIQLKIELTYDDIFCVDEEIEWFFTEYLNSGLLILHSNALGDEIGEVKVLEVMADES